MTKHAHSLSKSQSTPSRHHRFILNHLIHKKTDAVLNVSPTKNYRKSVSPSLVYRPLTMDRRQHVGFKVTYCGKGNRAVNFDKRKLSIVLIPDVNYLRSYRPIAGAIARQTRAEVICCAYQKLETRELNEDLLTRLSERIRFERSKLRNVDILSENDRLFDVFKQRLTKLADSLTNGVDITTPTEEQPTHLVLEEAPLSSPDKPANIPGCHRARKKRIQFVQISRESLDTSSPSIFKRVFSSITSKFNDLFRAKSAQEQVEHSRVVTSSSNFDFVERTFIINRNMNLSNNAHCDLIAKLMMSESDKY